MAESLGAVASVLTLIEAVSRVVRILQSCKYFSVEMKRLVEELSHLRGLLETLQDTINDATLDAEHWGPTIEALGTRRGPINCVQDILDILERDIVAKSKARGLTKIRHTLKWPYEESETLRLIQVIERYKGLFGLALHNDHVALTRSVREDIKGLKSDLGDLRQSVRTGNDFLETLTRKEQGRFPRINERHELTDRRYRITAAAEMDLKMELLDSTCRTLLATYRIHWGMVP